MKLGISIVRSYKYFDLFIIYNPTIVTFLTLFFSYIFLVPTVLQYYDIQGNISSGILKKLTTNS